MTYDIVYVNKDGSTGAYAGTSEECFITEVRKCIKLGLEFAAHSKPDEKMTDCKNG